MDILKMVEMQKKLDMRILDIHNLDENETIKNRILALLVELGELANEVRSFKYWSTKPKSEKSIILEEYVDGIHFLISLGNIIGYKFSEKDLDAICENEDLTIVFIRVFERIGNLAKDVHETNFETLWSEYIKLGHLLGFTEADIAQGYISKNELNHKRQDQNY